MPGLLVSHPMSSAFHLDHVTCRFGELRAVDSVSFEIGKGEQVALIGPSGSGKTTLIRLLNTMRVPDEGTVTVFGNEVSLFSPR